MVRVPRACMMNPDTARASPFCGELIDRADLQQWQAMCLHLLTERAAGPQSRWWPYLEHLPDMSGHPLLWDDAAVSALEGSPMHARLVARIDNVIDDLEELVAVGANELPVGRGAGGDLVTEESMRWATAVLLSRGFYLAFDPDGDAGDGAGPAPLASGGGGGVDVTMPPDRYRLGASDVGNVLDDDMEGDGEDYLGSWDEEAHHVVALVPWADALNHSSEAGEGAVLRFDRDAQAATLRADRDYARGDEVLCSYGPWKARSDLLLDHGFVDAANSNLWAEVPLGFLARPEGEEAGDLFNAAGAMLGDLEAVLDAESPPDESILSWVRAAVATPEELAGFGWDAAGDDGQRLASALAVTARLTRPASASNEARALESLEAAVGEVLSRYASSLQQDAAELEALCAAGEGSSGRASVLRALVGEKTALRNTAQAVAERRAMLRDGAGLDELWDAPDED